MFKRMLAPAKLSSFAFGEMAEWSNAAVFKTVVLARDFGCKKFQKTQHNKKQKKQGLQIKEQKKKARKRNR